MSNEQFAQLMQAIKELSAQIGDVEKRLSADIKEAKEEVSALTDMYGRHEVELTKLKRAQ